MIFKLCLSGFAGGNSSILTAAAGIISVFVVFRFRHSVIESGRETDRDFFPVLQRDLRGGDAVCKGYIHLFCRSVLSGVNSSIRAVHIGGFRASRRGSRQRHGKVERPVGLSSVARHFFQDDQISDVYKRQEWH